MVKIDALSHDGRGIAKIEGKTVFVTAALPGETVEIRYYKKHKHYDEAVCETVLEASSDRVDALCPHFSSCGGCNMQHMSSKFQHQHKQSVLLEQLEHFGHVTPEKLIPPLYDSFPWEYRHRARLSVRYDEKKGILYAGFRERTHPRFITDIKTCAILEPRLGKHIHALRDVIGSLEAKKDIPQVEIAATDENCALIFRHMVPLSQSDRQKLLQFAQAYGFWIILQPNKINNLEWLFPNTPQPLFYRLFAEDLNFYFEPSHFTQVNPRMNQKLVQQAITMLAPQLDENILDLFCGLGNFSLPLAKRAKFVTGIEGSEVMVNQAKKNAKANGLNNTDFYMADLSHRSFKEAAWANKKYDKLLLDPSRAGALEVVHMIEQWEPKIIVYVSCNPATFARDAGILVHQKGYHLRQVGIADMFPHTSHVESIALFEHEKW